MKKTQTTGSLQKTQYIRWFEDLDNSQVASVGGKNASLGEMIRDLKDQGIQVPDGFATTADAYWYFIETNQLFEPIQAQLAALKSQEKTLQACGQAIRELFYQAVFPEEIATPIREAYRALSQRYQRNDVDIAARSSATAEDLPQASFAGQQETFLNIQGEAEVVQACQKCFASLFTDRAISYREKNGFDHMKVALSVGIQKMVRADLAGAGVMFSIDTETGFPNVIITNAAWGIGENVVQGTVTPDEYRVFKPFIGHEGLKPIIQKDLGSKESKIIYAGHGTQTTRSIPTPPEEQKRLVLQDEEILQLAEWAAIIEQHYQTPMDMEWAKDGETGELFIVQARPETVQSRKALGKIKTYRLKEKGKLLVSGLSIGSAIASGKVCRIETPAEMARFQKGDILVTQMTEPDWVPIIRKASAVVTNTGGRTSHAAIVSREFGIPAVVGCVNATEILKDGQEITVSCAEGSHGDIYEGILDYEAQEINLLDIPETRIKLMMNIASPASALRWWQMPVQGIGLARMEFIINNLIKIHPLALTRFNTVTDQQARQQIEELTVGYKDKSAYFTDRLAQGIAQIAASQYPKPVLVRLSDFKSNEYASLIGGKQFEPEEPNPMLGFRGASRYYSEAYQDGFALECQAIRQAREEMGFQNILVMVPFCRTLEEADRVLELLAKHGLKRGEAGLQVYIMCEIPSNVILAKEFAERFDGFSIGSNDLTQLVLGVDRDSERLSHLFDESNEAVKRMIIELIEKAHAMNRPVSFCGQAPSDDPMFALFLVNTGIDSISLNPDSILPIKQFIAEQESRS